jgi:hypothetical protein
MILLRPGGPASAEGQGGRALTLTTFGVGFGSRVGAGVGRAVGAGVGCGVGRIVGAGVGVGCGVAAGGGEWPPSWPSTGGEDRIGTGVGPSAVMAPLGVATGDGSVDGSVDGAFDDVGSGVTGATDSAGGCVFPGLRGGELDGPSDALPVGAGVGMPPATSLDGPGVTRPAVSATVANTRLRRPMATTRRARWAEVTTTEWAPSDRVHGVHFADGSMVAPGPWY